MERMGITTSSMTLQECEFYDEVRRRRSERIERRQRVRRAEEARKARLDKVGGVACAVFGFLFFYALCILAFL